MSKRKVKTSSLINPNLIKKCIYCTKLVKTKGGRIQTHLTPGGLKCIGIGQPPRKG